jgi:hypothetical protein
MPEAVHMAGRAWHGHVPSTGGTCVRDATFRDRIVGMRSSSRRQFASGAGAALALAAINHRLSLGQIPPPAATTLILLGTAGGPRPRKGRAAPSQVILVNNVAYVVDCGNGVAIQLVRAGVPLSAVRHVFITHQHSDHNADYGNLLLLAWASGLQQRVDTWGPPPLVRMTSLFFEMNAYDIKTRISDEGRVPLIPLVHPHEITRGGVVIKDQNVTVTSALVEHTYERQGITGYHARRSSGR